MRWLAPHVVAVPARARDHPLNAHQRRERPGTEVRAGRRVNAGVEQACGYAMHRFISSSP